MEKVMKPLRKAPSKAKEPNTESNDDILRYLRVNYPPHKEETVDIKHLWGKNYRLNYWGKRELRKEMTFRENYITRSIFATVQKTSDGLIIKAL